MGPEQRGQPSPPHPLPSVVSYYRNADHALGRRSCAHSVYLIGNVTYVCQPVTSSDSVRTRARENPPPVGSIVSVSFMELTDNGVPRHPTFVRIRPDIPASPSQASLCTTILSVFFITRIVICPCLSSCVPLCAVTRTSTEVAHVRPKSHKSRVPCPLAANVFHKCS